jgi:aryl-alcohol dehydrogenase-like predicted oxidoreductase
MKALHDLVESGKVRYIGASSMWTWQFAHYNAVAEKVCYLSHVGTHLLNHTV